MNFNTFDISASALSANRIKMDAIASNLANVNTTRNPDGTPGVYRRKEAIFASIYDDELSKAESNENDINANGIKNNDKTGQGNAEEDIGKLAGGVKVMEITEDLDTPLRKVYNPSHPDADAEGYVSFPNVNIVTEMVDMMSASRAYEANVSAIKATKSMLSSAIKI